MVQPSDEQQYWLTQIATRSAEYVIGCDEVGAGALAGMVTVCAAVVRKGWTHPDVKDSKQYKTPTARRQRALLAKELPNPHAVIFHVVLSNPPAVIDSLGLRLAIDECAGQAIEVCLMNYPNSVVVMDGNVVPTGVPKNTICLPKADALVPAVSAASIIAKEHRDAYMRKQHELYPWYAFDVAVGYGTEAHALGLQTRGPCPIHRMTFGGVKEYLQR